MRRSSAVGGDWRKSNPVARCAAGEKRPRKVSSHLRAITLATFGWIALGLLLGLPGLARADMNFTFTTIDVPGAVGTAVDGNSPPDAISGEYDDLGGITHGFIFRGGVYTTIDVPVPNANPSYTTINGINASGQLSGTYMASTGLRAFFSPSQGVFTTLIPPGSEKTRSIAGFLNSQGQVVGTYRDAANKRHGFLWSRGTFINTMINVPNEDAFGTVVFGINDLGQIVGEYEDAADGNRHGFLLSQGTYTTLDPPGSAFTVAEGINNAGVIVGVYFLGAPLPTASSMASS